jgi:hypothetical protein
MVRVYLRLRMLFWGIDSGRTQSFNCLFRTSYLGLSSAGRKLRVVVEAYLHR